jgi:hypothetical protein
MSRDEGGAARCEPTVVTGEPVGAGGRAAEDRAALGCGEVLVQCLCQLADARI